MTTGREAMERLVAALPHGATGAIDPPAREDGVWMLDVTIDGRLEVVVWQDGKGYGLYDMPEPTYGQNPNVVVQDPGEAVARMLDIMDRSRKGQPTLECRLLGAAGGGAGP